MSQKQVMPKSEDLCNINRKTYLTEKLTSQKQHTAFLRTLKDKYPNFEVGLKCILYGESILTCEFLYKMKKRCKQITLMNVTKRDVTGPPVTHIRSYS